MTGVGRLRREKKPSPGGSPRNEFREQHKRLSALCPLPSTPIALRAWCGKELPFLRRYVTVWGV